MVRECRVNNDTEMELQKTGLAGRFDCLSLFSYYDRMSDRMIPRVKDTPCLYDFPV